MFFFIVYIFIKKINLKGYKYEKHISRKYATIWSKEFI